MRHERFLIAGAAAALMAVACDKATSITGPDAPAASRADALTSHISEQDMPLAMTEPNPCNDDVVTSDGTAHLVFGSTTDNTGGEHLSTQFSFRGTGVGLAPDFLDYTLNEQQSTSEQTPLSATSWLEEWRVIVKPPKPELTYMRHIVFKITINDNGMRTAAFERIFTKCGTETTQVVIEPPPPIP